MIVSGCLNNQVGEDYGEFIIRLTTSKPHSSINPSFKKKKKKYVPPDGVQQEIQNTNYDMFLTKISKLDLLKPRSKYQFTRNIWDGNMFTDKKKKMMGSYQQNPKDRELWREKT